MKKTIELNLTDSQIETLIHILAKVSDTSKGKWDSENNRIITFENTTQTLSDYVSTKLDYLR